MRATPRRLPNPSSLKESQERRVGVVVYREELRCPRDDAARFVPVRYGITALRRFRSGQGEGVPGNHDDNDDSTHEPPGSGPSPLH